VSGGIGGGMRILCGIQIWKFVLKLGCCVGELEVNTEWGRDRRMGGADY